MIRGLLLAVLPIAAFLVLNRRLFPDREQDEEVSPRRTLLVCLISALVIGFYDGFYGPGTGTFLIVAFTVFAKLSVGTANAQAKVINLTTNLTALAVFLRGGTVLAPLGLAAAGCNMLGNYLGSGLALLLVKILSEGLG